MLINGHKAPVIPEPYDPTPHIDSIQVLQLERELLQDQFDKLVHERDSLLVLPPKVIRYYDNQRRIIPNANVVQLDSIIRANAEF